MIETDKIKSLRLYNEIIGESEKASDNLPDLICRNLCKELSLDGAVLFRVLKEKNFIKVLGKSESAKKSYLKDAKIDASNCKLEFNDDEFSVISDPKCDVNVTDYLVYEIGLLFNIYDGFRCFLKLAKKTPFEKEDYYGLKEVAGFYKNVLGIWIHKKEIPPIKEEYNSVFNDSASAAVLELRNNVNSIIGFSSLLLEDNLTSAQYENVITIYANAHRILDTFNELSEISKIENSELNCDYSVVNLKVFLEDFIKVFKENNNNKNIEIDFNFEGEVENNFEIDEAKLKFILNTLISVQSQFLEKGKIKLNISASDSTAVFTLKDNGEGIPSEKLNAYFNPYAISKLDKIKDSNFTGLSLTLAKSYIELLRGSINFETDYGKGTTFKFDINLKRQTKDKNNMVNLPKVTADDNKILVVEDDYATSKLLSNYLKKWGYDPVIVNTAEQTLSTLEKEKCLAVILDIEQPNINGLELLQQIRKIPNNNKIPVIVCSVEVEQQKAFMMGAVEYFVKPINYNYLVETLTSYKLRKNSNVLCVDDDMPTLNLIRKAIETAGFTPIAENVSANVMELIKDKDIDLAIIDLDMPYPNGFELIELIKSEKRFAHLPIIIYTGKENYQEDLAKIDGMFDQLLDKKSTNIEDLADTISSMIKQYETPPPVEKVIEDEDGVKILLAEDYKHSQIIVTRLLKKNGFEKIIIVENGQEALDFTEKEHFDLILMDMQMPVMNGFEATEKIRELPNYKETPIIALTAFAMKGDREKCLQSGATDYIPKPIDSKEFIEKVKYYTTSAKQQ